MVIDKFKLSPYPKIVFGPGELQNSFNIISSYGNNVLLILGSNSFKKGPFYKPFLEESKSRGITFNEIILTGEPSPEFIDENVNKYRSFGVDVVVSIGGGSVLDAGKAISAMLKVSDSITNYLEGVGDKIHSGEKVPFIAIPTTSGTGSETTKNAVITKLGSYKKSLRHDNFIPNVAIVDPTLTLSCPKDITAACGLDAFTQLLGAYLSTNSSPVTDALALDGIKAIRDGLVKSYEEPSNLEARTNLSYASMISGIVLSNAGLGLVHGFASPIGALVNIPHGVVCGTLLGEVIEKNIIELGKMADGGDFYLDKYTTVASILSFGMHMPTKGILEFLVTTVKRWIDVMGIQKLSYYGLTESDLIEVVNKSSLKNNPVKISDEDMLVILKNRL